MALTAEKVRQNQYRTDGTHLYFVLHAGKKMSRVENCGAKHCDVEEIPTKDLEEMKVVERA